MDSNVTVCLCVSQNSTGGVGNVSPKRRAVSGEAFSPSPVATRFHDRYGREVGGVAWQRRPVPEGTFIRRSPIKQKVSDSLRRHSTDNKQAQSAASCACMLLHCCAALMHRADACAALQLLLLPVCCGACSRRPPCIIRVARRRLATQMCLCRGCYQTWRWHLRPCAHRHTADTRPRTRDTRA